MKDKLGKRRDADHSLRCLGGLGWNSDRPILRSPCCLVLTCAPLGKVPTQILGPVVSGENAVITFGTVSNRSYTIESSAAVFPMDWTVVTNLTGTGAKASFAFPSKDPVMRFFRVRQP